MHLELTYRMLVVWPTKHSGRSPWLPLPKIQSSTECSSSLLVSWQEYKDSLNIFWCWQVVITDRTSLHLPDDIFCRSISPDAFECLFHNSMNTKENQRSELCLTLLSKTSNSECGLTGVHTECLQIPQYATHLRVEGGLGMVLQISSLMILSSKSTQMIFLCRVPAPHSAEH